MLNEQTVSKMYAMKLAGMASSFEKFMGNPKSADLTFEELVGFMVDEEFTRRENLKLQRLLNNAKFKQQAHMEDIDYKQSRGLHKQIVVELSSCAWVEHHQNVLISGPTGVGKTYIACAVGTAACRKGHTVLYTRAPKFFTMLFQATAPHWGQTARQLRPN